MQRRVGPFGDTTVTPVRVGAGRGGRPTRKEVRGPGWRRSSCGLYVPSETPRTTEQRIAEAAVLVPAQGGITGWAALRWMGGRWFDGTAHGGRVELPVPIATCGRSSRIRAQHGIDVHAERMTTDDLVFFDGVRLSTADWATVFAMRHAPSVVEAVVAAEMSFFSDLSSLEDAAACLAGHRGLVGNRQARLALSLAHENSWSPMETRLRMVWRLTAGLPAPRVNTPVFDLHGRHVATPDLLDPEAGLAIEFDGSDFHTGVRRVRDNDREDALCEVGLTTATVLGAEFTNRRRLADRLQRVRRRALTAETSARWTLQPPPWWPAEDTVARRRQRDSARRVGPSGAAAGAIASWGEAHPA